MTAPNKIVAETVVLEGMLSTAKNITYYEKKAATYVNRWVPARPLSVTPLHLRIKYAFDVFLGKADALYWVGQ